jgi:uncharacterized repeat protein (TIGR01451 family)
MKVASLGLSLLLLAAASCRGSRLQTAEPRVPEYDPCGRPPVVVSRPGPQMPTGPVAMPSGAPAAVVIDERVSPAVDCNPVRTQHTLVVTVLDACGNPMPGQRVEWILARHQAAVGDIVATDDQYGVGAIGPLSGQAYASTNAGNKFDNQYAVSVTNFEDELIDAANNHPYVDANGQRLPDIRVGRGQTWITITSVVEGVTDLIAYVPAIKDGSKHKVFAKKIWADYDVVYPQSAENLLPQAVHPFTVTVRKASDGTGLSGTTVEAEVLDGPAAAFDGGGRLATVTTAGDGSAVFTLRNTGNVSGTNRIRFTTRGRFFGQECPRSVIVTKTWRQVQISCHCALSAAEADVGAPVDATFTISNTGDAPAENVTLALTPPAGLQIADGTTFPLSIGTVAAGQTVQRTVRFTAVGEGSQAVTWTAQSPSGGATTSCGCAVEIVKGNLEVACTCEPGTMNVGDSYQVVATVRNTGRGTLRNVVVQLVWPQGVTPETQDTVTLPDLPPGRPAPDQFVFQGKATQPGRVVNTLRATADGQPERTSACECNAVQCRLDVELICPGRIGFGEPGNFTAKVTNAGDGPATGCVLRITNGPCLDQPTIDVPLGTIAPGQTVAHDWVASGRVNSKCTVTAEATCQGCTSRKECEIEVTGLPAIQSEMVDKDLNGNEAGVFRVGDEFLYTLDVQNDVGTEATPPLKVVVGLPPELQFVSGTSNRNVAVSGSGQQASSEDFRLDVNEKVTFHLRVRVVSVPPGNWLKVVASIQRASDGAELASETESTTIK